jgi:hypothetical protein
LLKLEDLSAAYDQLKAITKDKDKGKNQNHKTHTSIKAYD